jgi:hypothetical protein
MDSNLADQVVYQEVMVQIGMVMHMVSEALRQKQVQVVIQPAEFMPRAT